MAIDMTEAFQNISTAAKGATLNQPTGDLAAQVIELRELANDIHRYMATAHSSLFGLALPESEEANKMPDMGLSGVLRETYRTMNTCREYALSFTNSTRRSEN